MRISIKRLIYFVLIVLMVAFFSSQPRTTSASSGDEALVEQAVLNATSVLTLGGKLTPVLNRVGIDKSWAIAIVGLKDSGTNNYIGGEWLLVLVHQRSGQWHAILPNAGRYDNWLSKIPNKILSTADRNLYVSERPKGPRLVPESVNIDGLKLPWPSPRSRCISGNGYGQGDHTGTDGYALDFGLAYEDVAAVKSGTISQANQDASASPYGKYIVMDIGGGVYALYAHLNTLYVSQGSVSQGTVIAQSGTTGNSTGPHLHFRLRDANNNPILPEPMSGYTGFQGFSCQSNIYYTSNNTTGGQTGDVGGFVKNRNTNAGIQGASVHADRGGTTETTDSSGRYTLHNVPSGDANVTATANGFDANSVSVHVNANASNPASDILLSPNTCSNADGAESCPGDGVSLCDNSNYGAPCRTYTYSSNDQCIALGDMDNKANSIKFLGSYVGNYDAVMYGDTSCGVYNARYDHDVSDFGLQNDNFSSMRLERHGPSGGIDLCDGSNYGSPCKNFTWNGNNNACISLGDMDNKANSIRFNGNYVGNYDAIMYGDTSCGVYNARYDHNVGDFGLQNDNFSSMRIEQHQPPQPPGAPHDPNPANGASLTAGTGAVDLSFQADGDQFRIHVWGNGYDRWIDWSNNRSGHVDGLVGQTYNWQAQARNNVGESPWSDTWTFTVPQTCFSLTLTANPSNGGAISASPQPNCPNDNTKYVPGTTMTLQASPNPGYSFTSWTGCDLPSGNACTHNMGADESVTANFVQNPAPTNDDFNNPTIINSNTYNTTENTSGATRANDDPYYPTNCTGTGRGLASVWFSFTPNSNGTVNATTNGSDYDTVLAVWSGARGSLTSIACSDDVNDSLNNLTSATSANLTGGVKYYVEVISYSGTGNQSPIKRSSRPDSPTDGGSLSLAVNFTPTSANDDFNGATGINTNTYNSSQDTTNATTASDDPTYPCSSQNKESASVWYRFTPTSNGSLSVNTIGSGYDTVLAIWRGSRGSLINVDCNDDGGGNFTSLISNVALSGGTAYYLEIASFTSATAIHGKPARIESSGGSLVLNSAFTPQTCYTLAKSVNPANGGTITASPAPNCNNGTQYTSGTSVSLTAVANNNFRFTSWSGDVSGSSSPIPVTMNGNKTVTANFVVVDFCYTLSITTTTGGGVTASPAPSCNGGTGYPQNTIVTLTATPNGGYTFGGWSGSVTGTTNPTSLTMSGPKSVTATFNSVVIPLPPTLLSPKNGKSCTPTCKLDWTDSTGATYYIVQVRRGTSSGTLVVNQKPSASMFTTSLAKGYTYYWKVRACNANKQCSVWSTIWRFKIPN